VISASVDDSIEYLKRQLVAKTGAEVDELLLLHRGRVLQNDRCIKSYNITESTYLDLALKRDFLERAGSALLWREREASISGSASPESPLPQTSSAGDVPSRSSTRRESAPGMQTESSSPRTISLPRIQQSICWQ